MVSPSVTTDDNLKVAEGRFCPPGDHLSTSNNFWDASEAGLARAFFCLQIYRSGSVIVTVIQRIAILNVNYRQVRMETTHGR